MRSAPQHRGLASRRGAAPLETLVLSSALLLVVGASTARPDALPEARERAAVMLDVRVRAPVEALLAPGGEPAVVREVLPEGVRDPWSADAADDGPVDVAPVAASVPPAPGQPAPKVGTIADPWTAPTAGPVGGWGGDPWREGLVRPPEAGDGTAEAP